MDIPGKFGHEPLSLSDGTCRRRIVVKNLDDLIECPCGTPIGGSYRPRRDHRARLRRTGALFAALAKPEEPGRCVIGGFRYNEGEPLLAASTASRTSRRLTVMLSL